jgi:hypothetical protein
MCLVFISGELEVKAKALTRVSLPVKIVLRIAVTLQVQSRLLAGRAVGEWNVIVGNIVEEMDFVFVQEETGSN